MGAFGDFSNYMLSDCKNNHLDYSAKSSLDLAFKHIV